MCFPCRFLSPVWRPLFKLLNLQRSFFELEVYRFPFFEVHVSGVPVWASGVGVHVSGVGVRASSVEVCISGVLVGLAGVGVLKGTSSYRVGPSVPVWGSVLLV